MPDDELEEELDAAYDPVGSMLEGLSEEQKQEIVDEVGASVVQSLKEENQEKFLRDLEDAVISNLPVVGMSETVQEGIRHGVRAVFDEHTEEMIEDAGNVVVDRLVESHSDEIVEDVIRTTTRKIRRD
jgi:ectoine hydroxylase-related dioxygenase (phytanoyl-CoA dioxygenase family)